MNKKLHKRIISVCLLLSMLTLTMDGMGFSSHTTAEAATHSHSSSCYTGSRHSHSSSCYYSYSCNGTYVLTSEIDPNTTVSTVTCMDCYWADYNAGLSVNASDYACTRTYYLLRCDSCGDTDVSYSVSNNVYTPNEGVYCDYGTCPKCGEEPYSDQVIGSGKTIGSSCWNRITDYSDLDCGKTEGEYYDGGTLCSPVCNKVVTNIVPKESTQIISAGQKPNVQATIYFLDGHEEVLNCDYSGLVEDDYGTEQTVSLSYGSYNGTAKTSGPYKVNIKVKINGYFDLNVSSDDANKGTVSGGGSILAGSNATVTATPNGDGYTFAGWYNGTTLVSTDNPYTFPMPAEAYALSARFTTNEYNLGITSEDTNKGTVSGSSGSMLYRSSCVVVATPNEGYSFLGWYSGTDIVSTENPYAFFMPANDYVLEAKFSANPYELGVESENTRKGTVSGAGAKEYGSSVTVSATPAPGYEFAGWYEGTTWKSGDINYTFTMPARAFTLTAKFTEATYNVTFDSNNGTSCAAITVVYGSSYGSLPTPTRSGYRFIGWQLGSDMITTGTVVTATSDHTLTAVWADLGPSSEVVEYDDLYNLFIPTKTGYDFAGWFLDEQEIAPLDDDNNDYGIGEEIKNGEEVKITTTTYVHARWTPKQFMLSFDSNGGTPCSDMMVEYDRTYGYYSPLPETTRDGYIFVGWYLTETADDNGTGIKITNDSRVQILAATTLYARWEPAGTPVEVTVTFDCLPDSMTVTYGSAYGTLPTPPPRPGFAFAGWERRLETTQTITSTSIVDVAYDHMLTSTWTQTDFFTFNLAGLLDWQTATNITGYGTVDIYIDGVIVADDVSVFNGSGYAYGTSYTIADIKATTGHTYNASGNVGDLSGTITSDTTVQLAFTTESYTVTFDANGGTSSPDTTTVFFGSTYGTLPTPSTAPSRDGYNFDGWYTDAAFVTQVTSNTRMDKNYDHTLVAKWTPKNDIVVSFDANGGTCSTASKNVTFNSAYGALPTPTKYGYEFVGWERRLGTTQTITSASIVDVSYSHTLYATWKAKSSSVLLDPQGATISGTLSVAATYDAAMPSITVPQRTYTVTFNANGGTCDTTSKTVSYNFVGYFYGVNGTGTKYYNTDGTSAQNWDIAADNAVLYAHWNSNSVTMPTPTRYGYDFVGWKALINGADVTVDAGGSYTPGDNVDFVAIWSAKTPTVTFNPAGGTCDTANKTVVYNDPYGDLPTPKKTGHTFVGWFTAADGGTEVTADSVVTNPDDHTLYALWVANEHVLSFDANTGWFDGNVAITVKTYISVYGGTNYNNVSGFVIEKTGYALEGWYTDATGGTKVYGADGLPTNDGTYWKDGLWVYDADVTLYAHWTARQYTVTFNPYGGTCSPTSKTVTYESEYGTLPTPNRDGYEFIGWFTAANGGTEVTADTIVTAVTSHTLYAQWEAKNYWVSFNGNDGVCTADPVIVTYDREYGPLPVPTRVGYDFVGWYTAQVGGYRVEEDSLVKIADDHTLYAHWEATPYTLFFDATGGTASLSSKTVVYDSPYGRLIIPIRTGYDFIGWFTETDADGNGTGTEVTADTIVKRTEDHTLYAKWEKHNNGMIHYDANGGAGSMASTFLPKGNGTVSDNTFRLRGYSFSHWNTKPDGSGTTYMGGQPVRNLTEEITLYAQWSGISYTIVYMKYPYGTPGNEIHKEVAMENKMLSGIDVSTSETITGAPYASTPYTVSYNTNKKPGMSTTPVMGTLTLDHTRSSGATFESWMLYELDSSGSPVYMGTQYVAGDTVTRLTNTDGDILYLYPYWSPIGSSVLLPDATCEGYTLTGWCENADGSGTVYIVVGDESDDEVSIYTPSKDITLYAIWEARTTKVTFDWNFDYDTPGLNTAKNWTGDTKSLTFDKRYGELPVPTRFGYNFVGWFLDEDASGNGTGTEVTANTMVTNANEHTLYAKWELQLMTKADMTLETLRYNTVFKSEAPYNMHQMLEFGDTLLYITAETDGVFDYMSINLPWQATPKIFDFDDGVYDTETATWHLVNARDIELFADGRNPNIIRNTAGYDDRKKVISIDFYGADGEVIITYYVNIKFVSYDVWKDDVIVGRQ